MSLEILVVVLMVILNLGYAVLGYLTRRLDAEKENRMVKALISKNIAEYAGSEATPADEIKKLKTENELAQKAVKLMDARKRDGIPIT